MPSHPRPSTSTSFKASSSVWQAPLVLTSTSACLDQGWGCGGGLSGLQEALLLGLGVGELSGGRLGS